MLVRTHIQSIYTVQIQNIGSKKEAWIGSRDVYAVNGTHNVKFGAHFLN